MNRRRFLMLFAAIIVIGVASAQTPPAAPQSVWVEAEDMGPLHGGNFSFQKEAVQTKGSWSLSGPGCAAEFMQGGESEFKSIAARADEAAGVTVSKEVQIPTTGNYLLWVRYGDYREKKEEFGVRVRQGGKVQEHIFGTHAIADDLDPKILIFDWLFVWDSAPVTLNAGPATVELYTTGPTEARRQVDCLCLTTDSSYLPTGRHKPDFVSWAPLRAMQRAGMPDVAPLLTTPAATTPAAWRLATGPAWFEWNVAAQWEDGLKLPPDQRIEAPYKVDSSMQKQFEEAFKGKAPAVYSSPLSGFTVHIPEYPKAFAAGSPLFDWLDRHPQARFSVLMQYGKPAWPKGTTDADKAAIYNKLKSYGDRFLGFVAGESLENSVYVPTGAGHGKGLEEKLRAAKSRGEVLQIMRDWYDEGVRAQMSDWFGTQVSAQEGWRYIIPCFSTHMESFAHSLFQWGTQRIGHESTGDSPTLQRRLAFLRGAARQFGGKFIDYQSCNFGDSSTIYVRNDLLYPATTRYVLDSNYDMWGGAGMNFTLKDYLLYNQAGAEAFYHEEGHDIFWKPAGGAAGDDFPVQLSPRGKVTERVQQLFQSHPRGTQYTPVAFLLDQAHGWSQADFEAGAFDLDPTINPAVLRHNRADSSIRGWFDVAYYPAPETQNEPVAVPRQTYVDGIFGDIFDVIVNAPGRTAIANTYPVLIASGQVNVSDEWGAALNQYVRNGGTLVVASDQFQGPGARHLDLPAFGAERTASAFAWMGGQSMASNVFNYRALAPAKDHVLATAPNGDALCTVRHIGKGQIVAIAVPLGIGIDERPVPFLGPLMQHLTQGLLPVQVKGDVEWTLNRLDDGGWVIGLFNNRGIDKPEHGELPTDQTQSRVVTIKANFAPKRSSEWMTGTDVGWGTGPTTTYTVPAGAVRFIELHP